MTPAELRSAAAKLRRMAAATTQPRSPEYGWDFLDVDEVYDQSKTQLVCSQHGGTELIAGDMEWSDAAWATLMGPTRVSVLARWLENTADWMESGEPFPYVEAEAFALAVLNAEEP